MIFSNVATQGDSVAHYQMERRCSLDRHLLEKLKHEIDFKPTEEKIIFWQNCVT